MINLEPKIKVALLQNCRNTSLNLEGSFHLPDEKTITGTVNVAGNSGQVILKNASGNEIAGQKEIVFHAEDNCTFTLDVQIGIDFHWERTLRRTFRGNIILRGKTDSTFNLINEISLEDYLASVISSEMSAEAPPEFLQAQAIAARSWLVAMLERKKQNPERVKTEFVSDNEIIRWFDINDHDSFDVCADDHCQRYQGITQIISGNVAAAIKETQGVFLVYDNQVCDARYYKCCGGKTENFPTAWENKEIPYLRSVNDSSAAYPALKSTEDFQKWLQDKPAAYCNTQDKNLLSKILPSFDQETLDFYRWQVIYNREELEKIILDKSGIDIGELQNLVPLERGPSGRINKLKIEGSQRTIVIGKELEIRRWLSRSHLLSSAFVV
jgi:SpoIID/LytB domain protein